jgi:CBS domain-containing protein
MRTCSSRRLARRRWPGACYPRAAAEQSKGSGVSAAELMSTPAVAIGPEESLATAARRMHDQRVRRLPVVDEEGLLAGIVSRVDVLSVFARPDEEIRDEVVREIIAGQFALDPSAFDVAVTSGIVTVTGQVGSQAVARQLTDAVRHVEGAVEVRDRITYPRANEPEAAFLRPRYQHR